MSRTFLVVLAVSAAHLGGSFTRADDLLPFGQLQVNWGDGQTWISDEDTIGKITILPDGTYYIVGGWETDDWAASWELWMDPDPAVAINVNFESNIPDIGIFEFIASVPSAVQLPAPTEVFGSTSINLLDNVQHGDGAELAALPDDSLYRALLNDEIQFTMLDFPFTMEAPPFGTDSHGPEEFSDSNGPPIFVGDVLSLRHKFSLTGFDTAQFVSTYAVFPEPATLSILALGALVAMRRRNR